MTVTERPPTEAASTPVAAPTPTPGTRSAAGRWRFAGRLGWREVRKRPGRTALVMLLIAIPTFAMAVGSIALSTDQSTPDPWIDSNLGIDADFAVGYHDVPDGIELDPQSGDFYAYPQGPGQTGTEPRPAADILGALPAGATATKLTGFDARVAFDGTSTWLSLRGYGIDEPVLADRFVIDDGSPPTSGEVALTPDLAGEFGVEVGDDLTLERPSGTWRVAAIAWDRYAHSDRAMWIPGLETERLVADAGLIYVDLPATMPATERAETIESFGAIDLATSPRTLPPSPGAADAAAQAAIGWVFAVAAFAAFGIVVVAAFATSARSQLVLIGQLSANGAPARLLRRVLMLQGAWSALLGAAVGALAALATTPWLNPVLRTVLGYPIEGISINWGYLAIIVATAVVTGVIAAGIPARSLSRVSVLSALAGRRPTATVPRWMVPAGVTGFLGGLGLLVISVTGTGPLQMVGAVVGVIAIMLGVCAISPAVVDAVGRAASTAPLSARISLRSLRRSRARSAAVISAIAVTSGIAAIAGAVLEYELANAGESQGVPRNVVEVYNRQEPEALKLDGTNVTGELQEYEPNPELGDRQGASETVELRWTPASDLTAAEAEISEVTPDAETVERFEARFPAGEYEIGQDRTAIAVTVAIFDPRIAEVQGLTDETVDRVERHGFVQLVERSADQNLMVASPDFAGWSVAPDGTALDPELIEVDGESRLTGRSLMTRDFADAHGFDVAPSGLTVINPDDLSDEQRSDLRAFNDVSMASVSAWESNFIEPGDPALAERFERRDQPVYLQTAYISMSQAEMLKISAIVLGSLTALTLLVAGIGLALSASESRGERAVLTAVGAKPRTMRRLVAMDAWAMSIVGAVLGIPAALFAAWALTSATFTDDPASGIPWTFVLIQLVAVPVVVAAAAFAGSLLIRKPDVASQLAQD